MLTPAPAAAVGTAPPQGMGDDDDGDRLALPGPFGEPPADRDPKVTRHLGRLPTTAGWPISP